MINWMQKAAATKTRGILRIMWRCKMKKTLAIILLLCALVGLSVLDGNAESKEFSAGGLTITLTDEFEIVKDYETYLGLRTNNIVVAIHPYSKEHWSFTLEEFISSFMENMGYMQDYDVTLSALDSEALGCAAAYESLAAHKWKRDSRNLITFYETDEYIYYVVYGCTANRYDDFREQFIRWAQSVTFE